MAISLKLKVLAVVAVSFMAFGIQVSEGQTVCGMNGAGLMACKPSVTPPNPRPPSPACCQALSHADIRCLCGYKNSKLLPSLGIDPNLAVQLPDKCKLPHPTHC